MPERILTNFILLPELKLLKIHSTKRPWRNYFVEKTSKTEVCPKCANLSSSIYDTRWIEVKDAPIRGVMIFLKIKKRRFFCKKCTKPFTEPIPGILPKRRTTQRYRKSILWACENFSNLKDVRKQYRCSNDFVYKALYEQLELKRRTRQYPWPETLGIDEHAFKKTQKYKKREFVTMFVDYKNKRLKEVALGKTADELKAQLSHIDGREKVKNTIIDMCDPYKKFIKEFFPNAVITADKFHVLRLLNPAINRHRKVITGDKRSHPIRKLLLRNSKNLNYYERSALKQWLFDYPELNEIYNFKEAIYGFYRIRGYNRAALVLTKITDRMASSSIKEIITLRKTLMRWRKEILEYFKKRLTNARTEGYNNVAKVVKRRSYGFRSFNNYRLRLLNACC